MIIDDETFAQLAAHVGRASDALLRTARHVAALSNDDASEDDWAGTLDKLMAIVMEMIVIDRLVEGLLAANRAEPEGPARAAARKLAPLAS